MKNLCLYNVSIHIHLYQNWFINECGRKIKAKTLKYQSLSFTVLEFHSLRVFLRGLEDLMFLIISSEAMVGGN